MIKLTKGDKAPEFSGVDQDDIIRLGFWNPVDASDMAVTGILHLDAVKFTSDKSECFGGDGGNGDGDSGLFTDVKIPVDFDNASLTYNFTDFDGGAENWKNC